MFALASVLLTQIWVCRVDSEFTDFRSSGSQLAFGTYNSYGLIDLDSGKKKWAAPLKEGELGVKVACDGTLIVASIGSGAIVATDSASGKPLWKVQHKGYSSPITISAGHLYAETAPSKLEAIDTATHKSLWSAPIEPTIKSPEQQIAVAPLAMGDSLLIGTRAGTVILLDAQGKEQWRSPLSDSPIQSLQFDDERIYVCSARGMLFALGRNTGTVVWRYDVTNAIAGTPLLSEQRLAIVSPGGFVVWVSALDGAELWRRTFTKEEDFSVTAPISEAEGILFMRRSGAYALDQVGRDRWSATFVSAASFRTPMRYKTDYILFDSHAVFRARVQ